MLLVAAVFGASADLLARVEARLADHFGPVALRSDVFAFDQTDYYTASMGPNLRKYLIAFRDLVSPDELASTKRWTNALEAEVGSQVVSGVSRPINVDPGYVSAGKFVLATTKDYSHRLYLGRGVYAEVTLHYTKGDFVPWPWTYPDYRTRLCRDFLVHARQGYMKRLRDSDAPTAD